MSCVHRLQSEAVLRESPGEDRRGRSGLDVAIVRVAGTRSV